EGGVWHYRIKLKTGEWYRLSSRETDFEAAKEIANRTYYTADYKEKNRLPQTTRRFKNVAKYALTRLEDELESGGGKVVYKDYIRTINNYLIPFFGKYDIANITIKLLNEYADWRDVQISLQKNRRKTTQIKKFRVSQSTINTHNSALNRVFDEAMLHGWITESIRPTLLNKGIKSESRGAFSEKEYKAIYTKLRTWWKEGHRLETRELRKVLREYVLFLGNTGIRHGTESITLKWNNLEHYIDENKDKYLLINVDGKRGKREAVARTATTDYLMRLQAMNPDIAHMVVIDREASRRLYLQNRVRQGSHSRCVERQLQATTKDT
ncbi:phage integrase SAM-like domain-containing protein, partial [Gammaproteobacteria bacterium]|nr:phage integrase SAM-like domain-containing protein [Gammaproteobacteria bacterium]